MRTNEDSKRTTQWAIAKVSQVSAVASGVHFMLANRLTGRAHSLYFVGGGFTVGIDGSLRSKPKLDYTEFETRIPCNFDDFDGVGARMTGIQVALGVGYSKMYLTIWRGSAYTSTPLAKIKMGGWGVGKKGLSGQAAAHGVLAIKYGNGDPMGLVALVLELDLPLPREEPMTRVQYAAHESPLLGVPGDALFDFDSARIKSSALPILEKAEELINMRDRGVVVIEGHTDSIGKPDYNKQLSRRRAQAVKDWLVQRRVMGAQGFIVEGRGADDPVEPNTLPDGRDNPEGRKKNRRVEIHFRY